MKKLLILAFLLMLSGPAFSFPKTPNINLSPGHLCSLEDKDFDRLRYPEGVVYCRRAVSTWRKDKICKRDGVNDRTGFTVDHIIPLSLGGSNSDENLWCQSRKIYTGHLEYELYLKLDRGEMRQVEAVHYILMHKFNPKGKN